MKNGCWRRWVTDWRWMRIPAGMRSGRMRIIITCRNGVREPGIAPGPGALTISGRTLLALAEENLGDEIVLAEAKQLMRKALGNLLGDKPLASRELYKLRIKN